MIKRILKIGLVILAGVGMILILAFSTEKMSRVKCDELSVIIPDESPRFIDETEISRLVAQVEPSLFDKKLDEVNANVLEQKLKKVPEIKNAEVYRHITGDQMHFKGQLVVEVYQREPLFRVLNSEGDFYMDEEGVRIPANPAFTAKVLLVTGDADETFIRKGIIPVVKHVRESDFLSAQIKQIQILPNMELIMVPLVGDQLIEFGDPLHYREKFRNLEALYEQVFNQQGWDLYNQISLKYKDQVVCVRK